jgi:hypothetical protein
VGSAGIAAAEKYIIEEFRKAGLRSMPGLTGFTQPFELTRYGYSREGSTLLVRSLPSSRHSSTAPASGVIFRAGTEMRPLPFSGSGEVTQRVVFAGYGIVGEGRDDYGELELGGAVALVLRGEPVVAEESSPFYGEEFTRHAYFSTKAERAYAAGASALLVVDVPGRRDDGRLFAATPSFTLQESPPPLPPELRSQLPEGFLALHVGSRLLELVAEGLGTGVEELVSAADRGEPPVGALGLSATLRVEEAEPVRIGARNIVGRLPANTPRRDATAQSAGAGGGDDLNGSGDGDLLLIGAHHDHLGSVSGPGDSVYNGADDNASGVATLLEIARILSAVERDMEVVFVTFSAEEHGLLGARSFLESGLLDPGRIAGMVNFDMVGRNPEEPVRIYHNRRGRLSDLPFDSLSETLEVEVRVESEERAPSDQLVFHRAGAPTLLFFTGLHQDYHGLDDEAHRVDSRRHRQVTELAVAVIRDLLNLGPR